MNYYTNVLKKYADFSGRARRKEYWMFYLISTVISFAILLISTLLHINLLRTAYSLAIFIPSLAVVVRRLHDIGKSGAYFLFILIPLVGWIFLFVWTCTEGDRGDNAYGPDPKA